MLLKPFAAYITGIITTAIAVSAGCGHWGFICFVLGIFTTLALIGWGLSSKQRVAWVVKHLARIADLEQPEKKAIRRIKGISDKVEPEPAKPSTFADCVLGLVGLGCDKPTARWAAGQATQRLPDNAQLDEVFKLALSIMHSRAAA